MKKSVKQLLALVLAFTLLLSCIPMTQAFAVDTNSGGPLFLREDEGTRDESGRQLLTQTDDTEGKYAGLDKKPFGQSEQTPEYEDTDVVRLVVEVEGDALLTAGFSAQEIADETPAVQEHQARQIAKVDQVKALAEELCGGSENYEMGYTYTVATTGFSLVAEYGYITKLSQLKGVKNVYVAPQFELPTQEAGEVELQPYTGNATEMIGSGILNETGYTGKGMKVAILDTGIVLDNPSFAPLTDDQLTEESITPEFIEEVWTQLNAGGSALRPASTYYSTKIPFIFNYEAMDLNVSHDTAGSDHGTHVAGIVAANELDSTEVVGVAPEAQLVIMQVFSSRGANWDVIMAAMEDCIRLDVDAINLSLGAAAGFTTGLEEMHQILDEYAETDIHVVIAAGNDTHNGMGNLSGIDSSLAGNPDVGLVGTPSTFPIAFSVASVNNNAATLPYFTLGEEKIGYADSGINTRLDHLAGKTLEYVMVPGYGESADFEGLDLNGKVAVVSRGGGVAFTDKQANAQAAGAVACIVYNNEPGMLNMSINDSEEDIPCVQISQDDGALLAQAEVKQITITDLEHEFITDPMMSDFSSWGCTPDLKLKPEISGVGGNIYSTRETTSGYGYMSGTSMASPQVSGAMAVLMQYLQKQFPEYTGPELRKLATNLMMSTAQQVWVEEGLEYSPRNQGAGLVDLVDATSAGSFLSCGTAFEGRPKGEFGDDPEKTGVYQFPFSITNFDGADKTYTFDASVLTEAENDGYMAHSPYALAGDLTVYTTLVSDVLKYDFNDDGAITTADARVLLRHLAGVETILEDDPHAPYADVDGNGIVELADVDVVLDYCAEKSVSVDFTQTISVTTTEAIDEITVPAGQTVTLTAQICLTDEDKAYLDDSFANGMFVEGYLYANSAEEDGVDLSMPFLGFYGDWSDAPVFDDPEDPALYGTDVWTNAGTLIGTNPYILSGAAGDEYNAYSYANPLAELDFGMLRNAKKLLFTVVDKNTGEEYFSLEDTYATKSYYDSNYGMIVPYYIYNATEDEEYVWKGCDAQGNALPDGTTVTYTVEAWLDDGDDLVDDTISFDVTLDSYRPEIVNKDTLSQSVRLDEESGHLYLSMTLQDNRYIAAVIFMDASGNIMGKYGLENVPGEEFTVEFDITGYGGDFTVLVCDYACNETMVDLVLELDEEVASPTMQTLDKGRLYGFEPISVSNLVDKGWFSVNKADLSDPRNESYTNVSYFSGEYINGRILAQRQDGALVLVTPYSSYWGTQEVTASLGEEGDAGFITLYDMALDYTDRSDALNRVFEDNYIYPAGDDTLFAIGWTYDGTITANGRYGGENCLYTVYANQNSQLLSIQKLFTLTGMDEGTEMITLSCDNEGNLYSIGTDCGFYAVDKNTGVCTKLFELTDFYNDSYGIGPNMIQSACYDHEAECIYWYANSQIAIDNFVSRVYRIDPKTQQVEKIGSNERSGATALFVPTDKTTDLFTYGEVDPNTFQLDPYEITMVIGQGKRINVNWDPWNARRTDITWTSSDESVVTVSGNGFIRAVGTGTATITATGQALNWGTSLTEYRYNCAVTVLPAQDEIYGYIVSDEVNKSNQYKWVTYGDLTPTEVTQLTKPQITAPDGTTISPMWSGGAYYDGYVYTVGQVTWTEDNIIYTANGLYKSLVDPTTENVIGQPELIGYAEGIEVGNLGFDYNTGRMYGVDLTNGGLCIVDLETGAVTTLGEFNYDYSNYEFSYDSGDNVMTAMTVVCEGDTTTIVCASMNGKLFTVDPATMTCYYLNSAGSEYWFYGAMCYDYNTGNIYWNPCMGGGSSPLYLVDLTERWDEPYANIIDIGDVGSKTGVEQTVMFTIPETEPETKFIPVEDMWLVDGENITMLAGATRTLRTATEPALPTVQRKNWESSDPSVVTVDAYGNLTSVSEGVATITVTLTDKDGTRFTDSIKVTVLASAGTFEAFLTDDFFSSMYWNFWITVSDSAPAYSEVGDSMIGVYSLRAGEYFDGYFYGVDEDNNFLRINAEDRFDYKILGNVGTRIMDMTFDYTTGTLYGLTQQYSAYDTTIWEWVDYPAKLVKLDLSTGAATEVATLDGPVRTLAVTKDGTLYGAGSATANENAKLYTIDPATGTCTEVLALEQVIYDDSYSRFNSQMTYDYTTNRLYLNGVYCTNDRVESSQFYMVQLGEELSATALGQIGLAFKNGQTGPSSLGVLVAIPEESELPEDMPAVNLMVNKTAVRLQVGGTSQLSAVVQPASAALEVSWSSADPSIATVDENGLIIGVSAGETVITVTAGEFTATCTVQVLEDTTGSEAYTISLSQGLVKFDPELPNAYEQIAPFKDLGVNGTVVGLDVDEASGMAYILVRDDPDYHFPVLIRFDMNKKSAQVLGQLYVYTDTVSDVAYDPEEQVIYVASGYYIFEYYLPTLSAADLNVSTAQIDFNYAAEGSPTVHAVTVHDGVVYAIGRGNSGVSGLYMTDVTLQSVETVATGFSLPTVNNFCEMAYCAANGKFYVTDAASNLYELTMDGQVQIVGQLADGLDINGIAILSPKEDVPSTG